MKNLTFIAVIFFSFVINMQSQVVQIVMEKTNLTKKEEIHFVVNCLSEQDLEITVFTDECLVATQKTILTVGNHPFDMINPDCPTGKYFILVTGNGIHEEVKFFVRE